jgi:mannose-1-phosphate guanylyltransferase
MGGKAMLAETIDRLDPLIPAERTWVVTNALQVEGIRACCPDLPAANILIEPCARNTSACVGLAAEVIHASDPDATLVVLPADHVISPRREFQRSLTAGAEIAESGPNFVTFGIPPTYPATGYGYIQQADLHSNPQDLNCYNVDSFKEKPDSATAQKFIDSGNYLWNSGIFVWTSATILNAISTHMPDLKAGLDKVAESIGNSDFQAVVDEIYPSLPAQPVDIGIMEKVDSVQVLAAPFNWSDVGSWKALYDEVAHDHDGNATVFASGGELLTHDAKGILAYSSSEQCIAVLGLDDIVVVHTDDAVLVAPRDRSEGVKQFVEQLKEKGRNDLL